MTARAVLLTPLLLLTLACASARPASSPWTQWATPEDAGFDAQALEEARASADKLQSAAVMVVYRGRVLVAWGDVARKLELHSVRKSLYAAMYGAATKRGLIDVTDTLAELGVDDLQTLTPDERKATLEDLLYARSGVYHFAAYAPADQARNRPARGSHAPGTRWFYNNWDFNVAGALLERAAKQPLGNAFAEWIATPIGMEDYQPSDVFAALEPRTSRWPAYIFRMSARDLARFGQLWLQRGEWEGREVIPAAWIDRASTPRSPMKNPADGYAMMWWTHAAGALPAERYPHLTRHAMIRGSGTGGQSVTIVPALDLVYVHRGDTDHDRQVDSRHIWSLLEQIVAARRGEPTHAAAVPLRPVALTSQLPAFTLPTPVPVSPAALDAVTGRYQFTPDLIVTVYTHQGRLFATVPGLAEAELFAKSPTEYFIRIDPSGYVHFNGDTVRARIAGREMSGKRIE